MKELEQFQKVLNKFKYIRIFIRDQIISEKLKIDEENNKSLVENLIITTKYSSIHSNVIIEFLDMFRNIKALEIDFEHLINEEELFHKIHLPKLKELKIYKRRELFYFKGLNSLQSFRIIEQDDFDFQTIDKIFDPN